MSNDEAKDAIDAEDEDRLEELIPLGFDVDAPLPGGATPLVYAARNDKAKALNFLLERGAEPNLADQNGDVPHDVATRLGHGASVEVLESHGGEASWWGWARATLSRLWG